MNAVAPGPTITNIEATFASPLGAERVRVGMAVMPDAVEADALAASITFLLSDDGVNVNGVDPRLRRRLVGRVGPRIGRAASRGPAGWSLRAASRAGSRREATTNS